MSFLKTVLFFSCLFLAACADVKRDQYVAEGYRLFQTHCANCHQEKGSGLSGLYPPITKAFLLNKPQLSCWIQNGITEKMVINGDTFSRPMPANKALKDLEIAEIITYLQNNFEIETTLTPTDSVRVWLEKCK